jgi:salicylate hydroxylase
VEDIAVLEYLLETQRKAGIPAITKIWQSIRIPRTERIKEFAAWNTRVFLGEESTNPLVSKASGRENRNPGHMRSLKTLKSDQSAPFHTSAFLKWVQDYDAVGEAKKHVDGLKAKI